MLKKMMKYGVVFVLIYAAIQIVITIYFGKFRPIETNTILPLLSLVLSLFMKPELIGVKLLQQFGPNTYPVVLVIIQIFAAFVQGTIIGAMVNLFTRKKIVPTQQY